MNLTHKMIDKMERKELLKLSRPIHTLSQYDTNRIRVIIKEWIDLGKFK